MASLALPWTRPTPSVRKPAGSDLQTLFVDEGFGTLDDESLEQVMAVLDDLREGGRAVGVVSHVAELRNRIPSQIVVRKTERGSSVQVDHHRRGRASGLSRPRTPVSSASALEGLGRGAGADQVAVAVGAVDAAHRRPVLGLPQRGRRVRRGEPLGSGYVPLARPVPRPCAGRCAACCRPLATSPATRPRRSRRRMAIIASQNRSISSRSSLSVGSTISVPATGNDMVGGVEAVVDEPLGHVVDGDAGTPGDVADVDDAFMGDPAPPLPAYSTGKWEPQPGGDV